MNTTIDLTYDEAHAFVNKNVDKGFYWDGWDIVKWTANPNGFTQKNGMYRNGTWGFKVLIPLRPDGTWRVLEKYV